jgi:hypothetical protein
MTDVGSVVSPPWWSRFRSARDNPLQRTFWASALIQAAIGSRDGMVMDA